MADPKSPVATLSDIANHIADHHPNILASLVDRRRRQVSNSVADFHKNTVAYGPLRGLKLRTDSHWGAADRGVMALGLYEREVLEVLEALPRSRDVFIDLGAADGYYGVGVLVNQLFAKTYCYEITPKGRDTIQANADLNGVADRVLIRGEATLQFFEEIPADERARALLLVDIEGGEFDVINEATFAAFAQAVVLIEIHDWIAGAEAKIAKLRADAEATHSVTTLVTSTRDLSGFRELRMLNDNDRWLLCSEGRPRLMSWLRFDPID